MSGACLKIQSGPAAVGFGGGQGGQGGASPQSSDCLRATHGNPRELTGRGLGSQFFEAFMPKELMQTGRLYFGFRDYQGWGLGKTAGEALVKLLGLVGFRGNWRLHCNWEVI